MTETINTLRLRLALEKITSGLIEAANWLQSIEPEEVAAIADTKQQTLHTLENMLGNDHKRGYERPIQTANPAGEAVIDKLVSEYGDPFTLPENPPKEPTPENIPSLKELVDDLMEKKLTAKTPSKKSRTTKNTKRTRKTSK